MILKIRGSYILTSVKIIFIIRKKNSAYIYEGPILPEET